LSNATPNPSPIAAFLTREKANAGIVLDLVRKNGTPTGESLTIYGMDSDAFRAAKAESEARLAALIQARTAGIFAKAEPLEERLRLVASLVKEWSFPEPCTLENVLAFLRRAPQLVSLIDTFAADRSILPS